MTSTTNEGSGVGVSVAVAVAVAVAVSVGVLVAVAVSVGGTAVSVGTAVFVGESSVAVTCATSPESLAQPFTANTINRNSSKKRIFITPPVISIGQQPPRIYLANEIKESIRLTASAIPAGDGR
ncbi:MAG: hypothetical protein ACE5EY_02175 [Anaerolineae bacterium]